MRGLILALATLIASPAAPVAAQVAGTTPAAYGGGQDVTARAQRYMVGFTRLRQPSGTLVNAAAGTNFVGTHIVVGSPSYRVTTVRCHFAGWASTEGGNSPQETVLPGNATIIDGFALELNGTRVAATFAGASGVTIASGSAGAWTDPIDLPAGIPAESAVAMLTGYHTAVGEKQIPVYRIQTARGERVYGAGDAASIAAMLATAASSTASLDTGFGQSMPAYYGPDLCVARGWDGRPVALVAADSIGEARQEYAAEADARGNLGWLRKWLDVAGVWGRTPAFFMGMPGAASARELSTNALLRWQVLDQAAAFNTGGALPFTVLVNQFGQNDLQASYATMQNNWNGLVDRFRTRYPGVRIVATGVFPRTSSSNSYTTRAGQTPVTGNEWASTDANGWGNGVKWQLEAFKSAGAGGRVSAYIDTRPFWFDAAFPGTWPVAGPSMTLAAQAGSDGVAAYTTIQTTTAPRLGDILVGGGTSFQVQAVGGSGPYTITSWPNTLVVPAGTVLTPQTSPEGVHPLPSSVAAIVDAVPQANKAMLQ